MNVSTLGVLAAGAAGLSAAVLLFHPVKAQSVLHPNSGIPNAASIKLDAPPVPEFSGYRKWTKINSTPQYIMSMLDLMCSIPTQAQIDADKQNPHVRHYMLCYVNSIGEHAMLHQKHPKFPVGSAVVKEKLDSDNPAASCSLITGMIKHAAGYDPSHGDWEYLVTNGDATVLEGRGRLANCGGCHAGKKNTDYVFRDEMGYDRLAKLK